MNVLFQQDPLYVGLFSGETGYIAGQRATEERLPSKPVEIEPGHRCEDADGNEGMNVVYKGD
jgi:hypothetical protein